MLKRVNCRRADRGIITEIKEILQQQKFRSNLIAVNT